MSPSGAQPPPAPARRRTPPAVGGWRSETFVVIDLETTGLNPRRDHIVSYGAVPIRRGRVIAREAIYGLVRVVRDVPADAAKIHTLRRQDLTAAPPLADAVSRLCDLTGNNVVVAHAAWIERLFLRRAFHGCGLPLTNQFLDTAELVSHVMDISDRPDEVVALEYSATALNLPVFGPHHALGDAMTTAVLFLAVVSRLSQAASTELSPSALLALCALTASDRWL